MVMQDDPTAVAKQDMAALGSEPLRAAPSAMRRISEEPAQRPTTAQSSQRNSVDTVPEEPEAPAEPLPEGSRKDAQNPRQEIGAGAVCDLLGKSSTAASMERPKGLGQSRGLPTKKRPSSAKSSARNVRLKDGNARVSHHDLRQSRGFSSFLAFTCMDIQHKGWLLMTCTE